MKRLGWVLVILAACSDADYKPKDAGERSEDARVPAAETGRDAGGGGPKPLDADAGKTPDERDAGPAVAVDAAGLPRCVLGVSKLGECSL